MRLWKMVHLLDGLYTRKKLLFSTALLDVQIIFDSWLCWITRRQIPIHGKFPFMANSLDWFKGKFTGNPYI